MRIRFAEGTGDGSPELRKRLERQLRLVVGRRAPSVTAMEVTVAALLAADAMAPAARYRCRIEARLVQGGRVLVDEFGADVDHAIEVAAWRLDRRLDRLERLGGPGPRPDGG